MLWSSKRSNSRIYLAHLLAKYGNNFFSEDELQDDYTCEEINESLPPLNRYFPGCMEEELDSIKKGYSLTFFEYSGIGFYLGYSNGESKEGLGVAISC